MKWNWTPWEKLHVYFHCKLLSKVSFQGVYDKLVEHFFAVLYMMIFETKPPCMTYQAKEALYEIVDWFTSP